MSQLKRKMPLRMARLGQKSLRKVLRQKIQMKSRMHPNSSRHNHSI
jgi:hypothetical protein